IPLKREGSAVRFCPQAQKKEKKPKYKSFLADKTKPVLAGEKVLYLGFLNRSDLNIGSFFFVYFLYFDSQQTMFLRSLDFFRFYFLRKKHCPGKFSPIKFFNEIIFFIYISIFLSFSPNGNHISSNGKFQIFRFNTSNHGL